MSEDTTKVSVPIDNPQVTPDAPQDNSHSEMTTNGGSMQISVSTDGASTVTQQDNNAVQEPITPVDDKFSGKTNEEIIEMYKNLEKKLGSQDTKSEEMSEKVEQVTEGNPEIKSYQDLWSQQGGKLTDEQWSEVQQKTGFDMDSLKSWEAFVKSTNVTPEQQAEAIVDKTLGDKYDIMAEWANNNMSDSEINAIHDMLKNPELAERGANLLSMSYKMATGNEPALGLNENASQSVPNVAGFASDYDMQQAMLHPDYGKGGAYDKEFDAKLKAMMGFN